MIKIEVSTAWQYHLHCIINHSALSFLWNITVTDFWLSKSKLSSLLSIYCVWIPTTFHGSHKSKSVSVSISLETDVLCHLAKGWLRSWVLINKTASYRYCSKLASCTTWRPYKVGHTLHITVHTGSGTNWVILGRFGVRVQSWSPADCKAIYTQREASEMFHTMLFKQ